MPVPHCLNYCSCSKFEIGKHESSNLVRFFKDCFGPSGFLAFPINFIIACQFLQKKSVEIFDKDCIESVDQFRWY